MASGGGRGNIAPFVVGKFIVKAVMGNLFKAPVVVVGIAYSMHNPLAGRGRDRSEVIAVVVGVVCSDTFRIGDGIDQSVICIYIIAGYVSPRVLIAVDIVTVYIIQLGGGHIRLGVIQSTVLFNCAHKGLKGHIRGRVGIYEAVAALLGACGSEPVGHVGLVIEVFICFVILVGELSQLVGVVEIICFIALSVIRSGYKVAVAVIGVSAARLIEGHHQLIEIRGVRLTVEHQEEADAVHLFIRIGGKDVALILLSRGIVVEMNVVPLEGAVLVFWMRLEL